jgi:adenylate cyclase
MALEIERKFLIDIEKLPKLENGYVIKQGYIQTNDNTVVRVRVKDKEAFLTIKGENICATRLEYEYSIPLNDANDMLDKLCTKPIIDKTRYEIKYKNHLWEIDIFHQENDGLIVAEVELESEDEKIELPNWIVEEVTNDSKYYNSNLIKNPFSEWNK